MGQLDPRLFEAAFQGAAIAMAIGTPEGRVLAVNDALCALVGYSRAQLLESGFRLVTPENEVPMSLEAAARLARGELPAVRLEKTYVHRAGHAIRAEVVFSLIHLDEAARWLVVQIRDITAQRSAEDEAVLFFEQSRDMLGIFSARSGKFERVNGAWEQHLGWTKDEMVGRPLRALVHPDDEARTRSEVNAIIAGRPGRGFRNRMRGKDGAYRWLEWTTHVTNDDKHFCVARDVTEQVRREDQLAHQNALNDVVFDSMSDSIYVVDNDGKTLRSNETLRREFGDPTVEKVSKWEAPFGAFLPDKTTRIPPDQLPVVQALQGKSVSQMEVWVHAPRWKEGRWHSVTANPLRDSVGRQLGAVIVTRDITERKKLQDTMGVLPPSGSIASQLLDGLEENPTVVGLYDEHDQLRWANAAYETRFLRGLPLPVSFGDVLRHGSRGGFGVKIERPDFEAFLLDVLSRRRTMPFRAFATDLVDGEWLWMTETRLRSNWLISIASVITPMKVHEQVLSDAMNEALSAAYSDALTGCANRRALTQRGQMLIAQAQRDRHPMCVAAIDLDHFKQINDKFGHSIGDAVLRQFAAHCQKRLRPTDCFGRLGGEEFIAVMPSTQLSDALALVDAVRQAIEPLEIGASLTVPYHFSAGVAQVLPDESWDGVLKRADQALYQAKARGRDRVEPSPRA